MQTASRWTNPAASSGYTRANAPSWGRAWALAGMLTCASSHWGSFAVVRFDDSTIPSKTACCADRPCSDLRQIRPAMSGQKSTKFSFWTVSYGSLWTQWQVWTIHSGVPDNNIDSSGRNGKFSSHTVISSFLMITIWLWSDTPFDLVQKPWLCRESSTLSQVQNCMHLSQGMQTSSSSCSGMRRKL